MAKKKVKKEKERIVSKGKINRKKRKGVPALVKVISVLYYISAVLAIIGGLVLFIAGMIGGSFVDQINDSLLELNAEADPVDAWVVPIILGSLAFGGIVIIALGVFEFFVARGLWKGRNWARIVVIIFMALGFLSSIFQPDYVSIVLTGLIGGYLMFSKRVQKVFVK